MSLSFISTSQRPEILQRLLEGKFDEVRLLTTYRKLRQKGILHFFTKAPLLPNQGYAYRRLHDCLSDPATASKFAKDDWLKFLQEYTGELLEMILILKVLETSDATGAYRDTMADLLLEDLAKATEYISQNSNGYPRGSINGKVWFDGAALRERAAELAIYFNDRHPDKALKALYLKSWLTCAIMSHYPTMVGPDMNAVAHKYAQLGNTSEAIRYFEAVVKDFGPIFRTLEEDQKEEDYGIQEGSIIETQSLIDALEGLQSLAVVVDNDLLSDAKQLIAVLKNE